LYFIIRKREKAGNKNYCGGCHKIKHLPVKKQYDKIKFPWTGIVAALFRG
jgi:hypothetical protein